MNKPFRLSIKARCKITADADSLGGLASGAIAMDAYNGGMMNLEGWDYPCVVESVQHPPGGGTDSLPRRAWRRRDRRIGADWRQH